MEITLLAASLLMQGVIESTPSGYARPLQAPPTATAPGAAPLPGKAPRTRERKELDPCRRRPGLPSLHGMAGNDHVYGGNMSYRLFGDEDRDFVFGGGTNDEINGGDDADVLAGLGGPDLFIFDTRFASLPDQKGAWSPETGDTIVDFEPTDSDKIDLSGMQKYGLGAPAMLRWSGSVPRPYSVWTVRRHGDTIVAADLDGDVIADLAIRLLGDIRANAASFCGVAPDAG